MTLDRKFPCVAEMEKVATKRVPRFAYEYLIGGIGREQCLQTNISALDEIKLTPRYFSVDLDHPDCFRTLFEKRFDIPFGVAPIGHGGLIWPCTAEYLAAGARQHNLPFALSGFATASMERIAERRPPYLVPALCDGGPVDQRKIARPGTRLWRRCTDSHRGHSNGNMP